MPRALNKGEVLFVLDRPGEGADRFRQEVGEDRARIPVVIEVPEINGNPEVTWCSSIGTWSTSLIRARFP